MSTRTALAALLAPVFLLTACGGSTSVADAPTWSSATLSATPAPHQRESPQHFIRRWAAEDIRMQNTGEIAHFRRMSRLCRDCLALAHHVKAIYAAGGYVRAGGWKVERVRVTEHARSVVCALHVDSKPTSFRESRNSPPSSYPGGQAVYLVGLKPAGRSWVVISLSRLAQ